MERVTSIKIIKITMYTFLAALLFLKSTEAFFPKLFHLENTVKSVSKQVYNEENKIKLNNLCNELTTYSPRGTMYVQDLDGPWKILSESNVNHEYVYQVFDYEEKVIKETRKFMNGTVVETTSPFFTENNRWNESKVYLSYSKETLKCPDGKSYRKYKTCRDNSFELIYASPSIRVEKLIYSGDIRVYEPEQIAEFKIDNVEYSEPCSENY